MRIKCTFDGYSFLQNKLDSFTGIDVCIRGLRQEIKLPSNVKVIDFVFSKRRHKGKSFPIDCRGFLEECADQYMLNQTRQVFQTAYSEGFRFVHVEY